MLKLYPLLGYHSVYTRFSARLIWAWMFARSACSGQVGYTSLEATLAMYSWKDTVTFWALAAGRPRCTVIFWGITT